MCALLNNHNGVSRLKAVQSIAWGNALRMKCTKQCSPEWAQSNCSMGLITPILGYAGFVPVFTGRCPVLLMQARWATCAITTLTGQGAHIGAPLQFHPTVKACAIRPTRLIIHRYYPQKCVKFTLQIYK